MRARAATMSDEEAVRKLLGPGGDLDTGRDIVVVVESEGKVVGGMVARHVALVHEFSVDAGLAGRRVAELAAAYMSGVLRSSGTGEAVMVVNDGNEHMQQWLEERGAAVQPEGRVYCLEVR